MLLRFGVANHLSIRDYQELLFTASFPDHQRLTMPVPVVDAAAVPVVALFGANASGKSNLLDAMDDMQRLVEESHKRYDATDSLPRNPFRLSAEGPQEPTRFECSFTLGTDPGAAQVYDLEVEFTELEITSERLRRSVQNQRRSTHTLYSRETKDGAVTVVFGPHLEGENQVTANLTRANSLFLSAAAQNNHPQLKHVHAWFADDWQCLPSDGPMTEPEVADRLADYRHRDQLVKLLQQAEAGVRGIEAGQRDLDEGERETVRDLAAFFGRRRHRDGADPQVSAEEVEELIRGELHLLHESASGLMPLDYDYESRGTRMFLSLALPALNALASGGLLVVDELDSSLHPRLARAFVSLFMRKESNPQGAQLVFSTHDVSLLGSGLLSQDEIWLVDKDSVGRTELTPLSDYRLRGDFERAYRQGRVGGTPELTSFFLDIDEQR